MERDILCTNVVEVLQENLGDNLEQVILFGSRADGTHNENSDYDFGVITTERVDSSASWKISCAVHGISEDIDLVFRERSVFDRAKLYHLNVESHIAKGITVFDSGKQYDCTNVNVDDVRAERLASDIGFVKHIVNSYSGYLAFEDKERKRGSSDSELLSTLIFEQACKSILWLLKTILLSKDVDTTAKEIRWNFEALEQIAETHGIKLHKDYKAFYGVKLAKGKLEDDQRIFDAKVPAFNVLRDLIAYLPENSVWQPVIDAINDLKTKEVAE